MAIRIEWRSKAEGDDVILKVQDDDDRVVQAWEANPGLLKDFLNDMTGFDDGSGTVAGDEVDPRGWGRLVVARSEDGDVLAIDPESYWDRIGYWFRSRGDDPHPYRHTG
jgi:hypothetical protein